MTRPKTNQARRSSSARPPVPVGGRPPPPPCRQAGRRGTVPERRPHPAAVGAEKERALRRPTGHETHADTPAQHSTALDDSRPAVRFHQRLRLSRVDGSPRCPSIVVRSEQALPAALLPLRPSACAGAVHASDEAEKSRRRRPPRDARPIWAVRPPPSVGVQGLGSWAVQAVAWCGRKSDRCEPRGVTGARFWPGPPCLLWPSAPRLPLPSAPSCPPDPFTSLSGTHVGPMCQDAR